MNKFEQVVTEEVHKNLLLHIILEKPVFRESSSLGIYIGCFAVNSSTAMWTNLAI